MKNLRQDIENELNRLQLVKREQLENAGVSRFEELEAGSDEYFTYDAACTAISAIFGIEHTLQSLEDSFYRITKMSFA